MGNWLTSDEPHQRKPASDDEEGSSSMDESSEEQEDRTALASSAVLVPDPVCVAVIDPKQRSLLDDPAALEIVSGFLETPDAVDSSSSSNHDENDNGKRPRSVDVEEGDPDLGNVSKCCSRTHNLMAHLNCGAECSCPEEYCYDDDEQDSSGSEKKPPPCTPATRIADSEIRNASLCCTQNGGSAQGGSNTTAPGSQMNAQVFT